MLVAAERSTVVTLRPTQIIIWAIWKHLREILIADEMTTTTIDRPPFFPSGNVRWVKKFLFTANIRSGRRGNVVFLKMFGKVRKSSENQNFSELFFRTFPNFSDIFQTFFRPFFQNFYCVPRVTFILVFFCIINYPCIN